jgi:hypothetical protein
MPCGGALLLCGGPSLSEILSSATAKVVQITIGQVTIFTSGPQNNLFLCQWVSGSQHMFRIDYPPRSITIISAHYLIKNNYFIKNLENYSLNFGFCLNKIGNEKQIIS